MFPGKISITTTLYNSSSYIDEFYQRCIESIASKFESYEFVFVNDGSPDNSLEVVRELAKRDHNVKVVDFSKNFGHHKALLSSLDYSSGDFVYLTDVDLEEEPELFSDFWELFNSGQQIDMVYGTQVSRKGGFFERVSGSIYYKMMTSLLDAKMPENIATTRLMSRRYVNALTLFKEQEVFIAGLAVITGFNSVELKIKKLSSSVTSYSFGAKINLLVRGVISFSAKPLYFIFILGLLILVASFLLVGVVIAKKLFWGVDITGWASLMIVALFSCGVITFSIGICAIYLSKIFTEVKNRPYIIVKEKINFDE